MSELRPASETHTGADGSERPFDVLLFGATGFTGRLTAEYIAVHARAQADAAQLGRGLRWAIAGRNPPQLSEVQRACAALGSEPQIVLASLDEPSGLAAAAASTRVLASTVGPYAAYGLPVAQACVDQATHYLDITGEPDFVSDLRQTLHAQAQARGVKLVSCCGFDSIPHDLGAWCCAQLLTPDSAVRMRGVVEADAEFSGGTWHSAVGAMANLGRRSLHPQIRAETGGGQPRRSRVGRQVGGLKRGAHYDAYAKGWVAPLPTIDPQIVLRSARALPEYGPDFRYGHFVRVGSAAKLAAAALAVGGAVLLSRVALTRRLLLSVKQPGQGPSAERRARSWFRVVFHARAASGAEARFEVSGGDPGYDETSKMLAESALCLALDHAELAAWDARVLSATKRTDLSAARREEHASAAQPNAADSAQRNAGALTPVVAMGAPLLKRLKGAGMCFREL